jgi:leader peptidase (prepilin peptidase) / N-methyltransferase
MGFSTLAPEVFTACAALIGLLVGSFLNVVIHRLPRILEREWQAQCAELQGQEVSASAPYTLARPRSACPHCGHPISAIENIPVISYLLLGGKCKACRAPISPRYPLVELLTALLTGFTAWHFGTDWPAIGAIILVWALIALAAIDLDTQLLPDCITLPLLWLGLLFNLDGTFVSLHSAVLGAIGGYLALWAIYWLFKLTTGKEGMGYGDFKLLGALGAWLGWQMLPAVVLLSSLVGATVGISLIVFARRGRNVPIPFGPYLAAAGAIALFWGQQITHGYLLFLA